MSVLSLLRAQGVNLSTKLHEDASEMATTGAPQHGLMEETWLCQQLVNWETS